MKTIYEIADAAKQASSEQVSELEMACKRLDALCVSTDMDGSILLTVEGTTTRMERKQAELAARLILRALQTE